MSNGAELQVILPIVNAPFRLFYAYNPLRLYRNIDYPTTFNQSFFPNSGAGQYSYQQAVQAYQPQPDQTLLREPRKTFRLTISTTF